MSGEPSARLRALGWCFQPLGILDKYVALSRALSEAGVDCAWLCKSEEAKLALLAHGVQAHSVESFIPECRRVMQCAPGAIGAAEIERLNAFDRAGGAQCTPLPLREDQYHEGQARFYLGLYETLARFYRPSVALNLNGLSCVSSTLTAVASRYSLPVFYLENGLLPGTLVVDRVGVNYGSGISGANWNEAAVPTPGADDLRVLEAYRQRLVSTSATMVQQGEMLDRAGVRRALGIPADHRVVLVPMQMEGDTNIILYSPVIKKMTQLIEFVREQFGGCPGVSIVVKDHPARAGEGSAEVKRMCTGNIHYVDTIRVTSLLDAADVVVCINSTVGLEGLLRHLPVVCLGHSAYSEKGFTHDACLEQPAGSGIQAFLARPFETEKFSRFLLQLLRHHLFPVGSEEDRFGARARILESIVKAAAAAEPQWDAARGAGIPRSLRAILRHEQEEAELLRRLRGEPSAALYLQGRMPPARERRLLSWLRRELPGLDVRRYARIPAAVLRVLHPRAAVVALPRRSFLKG